MNGFNASRRLVGGYNLNDTFEERRQQSRQGSPPVLQSAVVVDVVCDLQMITDEIRDQIRESVNNYELVDVMPINSVIAQLINDDLGNSGTTRTILFPLFSSHFLMPVNPGEVVHVIYQDFVGKGMKVGYWVSRAHGNRSVEDINYTHLDRQFDPNNNFGNWSTADKKNATASIYTPNFPNGGNTINSYTLSPEKGSQNPYDDIVEQAIAAQMMVPEVVPRWNKRPGEFIIQGSNNTLIVFGDDREGSASYTEGDIRGYSGKIDIVAGRGRYMPENADQDPEGTAPRVVANSRGNLETDKAPFRGAKPDGTRKKDNPNEGNPDYMHDASRLLVSMQTKGDEKLGVTEIEFPGETIPVEQPDVVDGGKYNLAYAAAKSDHIRLVARKNKDKGVKGTILLLREGDSEDEDLSYMFVNEHGMQIESKKVYLGRAAKINPSEATEDDFNGDKGGYEPYILWSKYKDTVDNLQNQINELKEQHQSAIESLRSEVSDLFTKMQISFASNLAIPYSQNPALTSAQIQISTKLPTIQTAGTQEFTEATKNLNDKQSKNDKDNVDRKNHSQKIYGE